ncbi:MAG: hypothetical protein IJR14_00145 [Synergistaceae bacterium]|nr:hypothetical protein [Synergistaceae bacterium]
MTTEELDRLIEDLEGQRREAFVRAVMRQAESDDVVGYMGRRVPVEIFEALGLMALPVQAVDGDILEDSLDGGRGLCPLIEATLTYAKTDRCPLIHSSRLIVVDDACPIMAREMVALTNVMGKAVHVYRAGGPAASTRLCDALEDVYGRRLDAGALDAARARRGEIEALLRRLERRPDLTGMQVYILRWYIEFIPMDERLRILRDVSEAEALTTEPMAYTPVHVQSGAGIYRQIDRLLAGRPYRIVEGEGPWDFVFTSCPFHEGTRIGYERAQREASHAALDL